MRKFDLLDTEKNINTKRVVGPNLRTIKNRIISTCRDKRFFDGDRNDGYGGYIYDGRWQRIAQKICDEYKLKNNSTFLHLNSEKGFLINDISLLFPQMRVVGLESSQYAIDNSIKSIKKNIIKGDYKYLKNFKDNEFDFVMAMGIYALNLANLLECLKEIIRISKNSFLTLASYDDHDNYWLFKNWTLLGTTILTELEWIEVLEYAGYNSDYYFTNAQNLNLVWQN